MSIKLHIHAPPRQELRIAARCLTTTEITGIVCLEVYSERGDPLGEVELNINNKQLAQQLTAVINTVMDPYFDSENKPPYKEYRVEDDTDE